MNAIWISFIRRVLSFPGLLVRVYILQPFSSPRSVASGWFWKVLDGLAPFLLLCSLILTADTMQKLEIVDVPLAERIKAVGKIVSYNPGGGRGGVPSMMVDDGELTKYELMSVKDIDTLQLIKNMTGSGVVVWYQQANGVVFDKKIVVQIEADSGGMIFDYSRSRKWFSDPLNSLDKSYILFAQLVFVFYLFYMPIRFYVTVIKGTYSHDKFNN
ncbi:MAG: hypothetical protein V7746_23620 [Halioglobus sp.]